LRVRVVALVAFHFCVPGPRVSPELIVRFCDALLMSMPLVPRVSTLPALIVTGPPGLGMVIPAQLVSTPSATELAPVTVESHLVVSNAPGITPPTQLVERLRLSVLLPLEIVAARRHAVLMRTARQARKTLPVWVFIGRILTDRFVLIG